MPTWAPYCHPHRHLSSEDCRAFRRPTEGGKQAPRLRGRKGRLRSGEATRVALPATLAPRSTGPFAPTAWRPRPARRATKCGKATPPARRHDRRPRANQGQKQHYQREAGEARPPPPLPPHPPPEIPPSAPCTTGLPPGARPKRRVLSVRRKPRQRRCAWSTQSLRSGGVGDTAKEATATARASARVTRVRAGVTAWIAQTQARARCRRARLPAYAMPIFLGSDGTLKGQTTAAAAPEMTMTTTKSTQSTTIGAGPD